MPKDTFYNLKEEKQQRILDAAVREVGNNGYEKASVTRIVKDAGIATGSFYQYFEDMDDLVVYIGMEAGRLKTAYMKRAMEEIDRHDLESCIRAMYVGGLRFGLEHEDYFRCAQSILQIKDSALYRKMLKNAESSELAIWMFEIVNRAIEAGEMPKGITPELFFRLLTSINAAIIEHLIAQKPNREMSKDDLETLCELGLQILLHGLRK